MEEFKSNSIRSKIQKPEPEKKEKIITGTAKVQKKNGFERFTDTFKDAISKVFTEIVVPAAKKSLSDGINNVADMMIYGEARPKSNSVTRSVSYRAYYDDRDRRSNYISRPSRVAARDYEDIVLETRGEADAVLNELRDTIARYQYARVADLYDLVGLQASYTDNNYAWDDLRDAYIERVRDGYALRLPKPMPID